MKLSIVLPCYNEELAITKVINDALYHGQQLCSSGHVEFIEVIVVNDGSTDGSQDKLSLFGEQIRVIHHHGNRGYGAAIKSGVLASQGDFIIIFDLDGTCTAQDIHLFIETLNKYQYMMVSGNRLSKKNNMPALRRFGNGLFALLVSILFLTRIKDVCSGYRLISKSCLLKIIDLLPNNLDFTLKLTLIFLSNKLSFKEIDITYKDRIGQSKLNELSDGLLFLKQILIARLNRKKYRELYDKS